MPDHPAFTPMTASARGIIPSDDQCRQWWTSYAMLDNIKRHSMLVAEMATSLATMAADRGVGNPWKLTSAQFVQLVRATALLHDLGKTYAIRHGGNHSQLGAAWSLELTRNHAIAQGVIHHVYWPGPLDLERHFLPLAIIYADKRVKHDTLVSIEDRFADLMDRYGTNERSRGWIERSRLQNIALEDLLRTFLGEDIHAYSVDSRRLVG